MKSSLQTGEYKFITLTYSGELLLTLWSDYIQVGDLFCSLRVYTDIFITHYKFLVGDDFPSGGGGGGGGGGFSWNPPCLVLALRV